MTTDTSNKYETTMQPIPFSGAAANKHAYSEFVVASTTPTLRSSS